MFLFQPKHSDYWKWPATHVANAPCLHRLSHLSRLLRVSSSWTLVAVTSPQSYFTYTNPARLVFTTILLLFLNGSLFSRHPSRLDAFSAYDLPRSCAACLVRQLLTRGDRMLFLSYWTYVALKLPTAPLDRIRPVSRRSKPSSRSLLMGVQPHPWPLVHGQDRKSRHRGSKPRGR